MYTLAGKEYFETLTEAKLYFITQLAQRPSLNENPFRRNTLIAWFKASVEQHEDKDAFIMLVKSAILQIMTDNRLDNRTNFLVELPSEDPLIKGLEALERTPFILPTHTLNHHATIGAVDSFLPAVLLTNPTPQMVQSRNHISQTLISTLQHYKDQIFISDPDLSGYRRDLKDDFTKFAQGMIFENSHEYPGVFTLAEINATLPDKYKISDITQLHRTQCRHIVVMCIQQLASPATSHHRIMAIHAMFGFTLLKRVVLYPNQTHLFSQNPAISTAISAGLLKYESGQAVTMNDFLSGLTNPGVGFDAHRAFVSDNMVYSSPLYQIERTRGRDSPDYNSRRQTLGTMRSTEPGMHEGLPSLPSTEPMWVDWSQCKFYPNSTIVQSMTRHETPFISSFSGTASLLLSLALSVSPVDREAHVAYLNCIMSYVAGVGFHSIHEILAPAAYCLEVIPPNIYPVNAPPASLTDISTSLPPRYHAFYEYASQSDPELTMRRSQAWEQLMHWYQQTYSRYHTPPNHAQLSLYSTIKSLQLNDQKDPTLNAYVNDLLNEPKSPEEDEKIKKMNNYINILITLGIDQQNPILFQNMLLCLDDETKPFLQQAMIFHQFKVVEKLIDHDPDLLKELFAFNSNALHIALLYNDDESAKLIIPKIGTIAFFDKHNVGKTPFSLAIEMNKPSLVDLMLRQCEDKLDISMAYGLWDFAQQFISEDPSLAISQLGDGATPLARAREHLETAKAQGNPALEQTITRFIDFLKQHGATESHAPPKQQDSDERSKTPQEAQQHLKLQLSAAREKNSPSNNDAASYKPPATT